MRSPTLPSRFAVLAALALSGCTETSLTAPAAVPSAFAPDVVALTRTSLGPSAIWSNTITGETKSGALYALHMPHRWNGSVVYYAHGIVPAAAPLALPTGDGFPDVRDALGRLGYAVAYSSFSENGWAVKDGTTRTLQLRQLFERNFDEPRRSYLVGTSMGGLIAQKIAESRAKHYDGILAMCAPLAGATAEVNYIGNVRVVFDALYPGVVPGDVLNVPPGLDLFNDVIVPVKTAITLNPTGLGIISRLAQTPLAGESGAELAGSLIYAIGYDVSGIDDFLGRTKGESMFDNRETWYSAAAPLPPGTVEQVNQLVGRFDASPRGERFLDQYYNPEGDLDMPTLTLHTTRDPLVPFFHEAEFAQRVARAHHSEKLVQRSVNAYGHCAFTTEQMVGAFQALAGWVTTGHKPAA